MPIEVLLARYKEVCLLSLLCAYVMKYLLFFSEIQISCDRISVTRIYLRMTLNIHVLNLKTL